ncbi:ABC transporter family protein [Micromonospora pisi]|uniref:ABC transporter family protein n=1 Tax=Micromonospora pisi TaxID=589240 RepID=A0A495JLW5_9ACTN|nr:ABC transporter ATP-binding protein [Micromonospora pisi]RKR90050.1 ABC transporter family protein [Micromonospora pisi]
MRLDDVWLRYRRGAPWVLRAVQLDLAPAEAAVVLGRNGVGKSTLLQLAAGVLRPTRGAVRDRPRVVGWVPERFPADQPFTIDQYLTAVARMRGLPASEAGRVVTAWTERLGVRRYGDVRLPELSKGTAQKVGLAQALLVRPDLLILDEPWEGLDVTAREMVPDLIAEVRDAGGSVLVSDHRGETVRLPGATQWLVDEGAVIVATPSPSSESSVVEIVVPTADAAGTVAALRAAGHQVLGVRPAVSASAAVAEPERGGLTGSGLTA